MFLVLLTLLLIKNANLEAVDHCDKCSSVVSTTQNPYNGKEKFEQIQTTLSTYKYRTELLELQNVRMQKTIEELQQLLRTKLGTDTDQNILQEPKLNAHDSNQCNLKNQLSEMQENIISEIRNIVDAKFNETQNVKEPILSQENKLSNLQIVTENCREVQEAGNKSTGIYKIQPKGAPASFEVLCSMGTRGGGWTHFLKRFDGSQNFILNWNDYKNGFGKLTGEFWLGLEHLYQLTGSKSNELLVELEDWDGKVVHAHYGNFSIGSEAEGYSLKVLSDYSGDAGDSLKYHLGHKFSTQDHMTQKPAPLYSNGGWWYHSSFHVKLTGAYYQKDHTPYGLGIHWGDFHGYSYGLKRAKMMVRSHKEHASVVV